MVSIEVSQFCPLDVLPWGWVRRDAVPRPVPPAPALDFRATEVVFDLAAERALLGRFMDLVAALELPVALGCARLLAVDEVFDPLRDGVEDFAGVFRPARDCFFWSFFELAMVLVPLACLSLANRGNACLHLYNDPDRNLFSCPDE
jgi:hypothetical protein